MNMLRVRTYNISSIQKGAWSMEKNLNKSRGRSEQVNNEGPEKRKRGCGCGSRRRKKIEARRRKLSQ
jgi:hypothetical protein